MLWVKGGGGKKDETAVEAGKKTGRGAEGDLALSAREGQRAPSTSAPCAAPHIYTTLMTLEMLVQLSQQ